DAAPDRDGIAGAQLGDIARIHRPGAPARARREAMHQLMAGIGEALDIIGDIEMAEGVAFLDEHAAAIALDEPRTGIAHRFLPEASFFQRAQARSLVFSTPCMQYST